MIRPSKLALALTVALAGALAAPLAGAAPLPTDLSFRPRVALGQGAAVLRVQRGGARHDVLVQWQGVRRIRSIDPYRDATGAVVNVQDFEDGALTFGTGGVRALRDGLVIRNSFSIAPDGRPDLQTLLIDHALPLITRQRSGLATFARVKLAGGRTVLRAKLPIAPVECAALPAGTRTVDLDPVTFLPVRVLEVRGGKRHELITVTRRQRTSGAMPAIAFTGSHRTRSEGFVRRSPVAAAATGVPFVVSMPSSLPDGFVLARSGSAKRGSAFGPEASFPRSNGLFAAQWRRGLETLDLTIRSGSSVLRARWDDSEPFGYECGTSSVSDVTVSGHAGRFALGEYGGGRLWWRDGATMYTLTAPLPKDELVRVAESLAPVSAG